MIGFRLFIRKHLNALFFKLFLAGSNHDQLWNDPAVGVMRHADAGYDIAKACAREHGLNLPGIELSLTITTEK